MAAKKQEEVIKPNCKYCANAGEVNNYMCMCSILGVNRAACFRNCTTFVIDRIKYNQFKN